MIFLKEKLGRNKTVLANFSYLSILQVFTILFPLLTYPYLLRVIGLELYGVIVFAQEMSLFIRTTRPDYQILYHLLIYVN